MRIKKQRKQEIEQELIELAERLVKLSREIESSIHLDVTYNPEAYFTENEKTTVSISLHGRNAKGDKRTFRRRGTKLGETLEVFKGLLSQRPEYYK